MRDAPFYSPEGLAQELNVPLSTVYRWNSTSTGPRRIHIGRHVRYRREDVAAWLEQRSDPVPAA